MHQGQQSAGGKIRPYTIEERDEMRRNFKDVKNTASGVVTLRSEALGEIRRQVYGPGKTKFTEDEWKSGKLRLYSADPGKVLVLIPKDPDQTIRLYPTLPERGWRASAVRPLSLID